MKSGEDQETKLSSDLCLACGLCCDGSIFSHVELDEEDRERLEIDEGCEPRLSFPCKHLSGTRCTIYPKRPKVCASYRCKTLTAFELGMISHDDAHDVIREAARLRHEFEAAIPPGITRRQAIICVVKDQCPNEASNEEFLRLRLTYVAIQAMVDRHMRRKGENVIRSEMRSD